MSNNVGPLYQAIIEEVIREARQDFADLGEQESTLQLLQKEWQNKLASFRVASYMPWEQSDVRQLNPAGQLYYSNYDLGVGLPPPADSAHPPPPGSVPGAVAGPLGPPNGRAPELPGLGGDIGGANSQPPQPQPPNLGRPGAPYLKQEEGSYTEDPRAAARAAHNVQKFVQDTQFNGPNAANSVRGLMARSQGMEMPYQGLELPLLNEQPYYSPSQSHAQLRQNKDLGSLPQVDGLAGDTDLRDEIAAIMERETNKHKHKHQTSSQTIRQTDGLDETVGSDLDDSEEDLLSEAVDDDGDGMIMLCLYEKVQRVKNKWKYVLKDGVANINGLDYVFSKGTGESEW